MVRLVKAMPIEKIAKLCHIFYVTKPLCPACILICGEVVVLFGSLKGIIDGEDDDEDPVVEVLGVELLLVLELVARLGSLNGIRELLLLIVELTVELLELVTDGVTVEVFTYGVLPGCFVK